MADETGRVQNDLNVFGIRFDEQTTKDDDRMVVVGLYGLHVDVNKVLLNLHDYCVPQNIKINNSNSIEVGNSQKQDQKADFFSFSFSGGLWLQC